MAQRVFRVSSSEFSLECSEQGNRRCRNHRCKKRSKSIKNVKKRDKSL